MIFNTPNLIPLLHTRILVIKNSLRKFSKEGVLKFSVLFIVGFIFLILDYLFFHRVIKYIFSLEDPIGRILISQLLRIIFITFLSMLFFSNIITSLSTLYISLDLEFLLYCPIPSYSTFISKYIQTIFNSSWMIALFGFPIFLALGRIYGVELKFYFILCLLFIPFAMISANFGILITMILVRIFPARKTYQVMTFLGIIFAVGLIFLVRFSQPEKLVGEVADEMIVSFLMSANVPDYWFLPSTWAVEAIKYSLDGGYIGTYRMLWLFYSCCIITFLFTVFIATRIYFPGIMRSKESIGSLRDRNVPPINKESFLTRQKEFSDQERLLRKILKKISPDKRSLWEKDIKLFLRDPTKWSQVFMLLGLIVIYFFNIYNLPLNTFFLKNLVSFLNLGLAGFVLSALCVRFVYPAISLEGFSIWILLSGPINYKDYIWGKFYIFFIPLFIISESLIIVSNLLLGVDNYMMLLSIITMFFITLAVVGLGVGFGAMYPKFRFDDPAEVSISTGGILFMIVGLIYVGLIIVLEAGPVYAFFQYKIFYKNLGGIGIYLSYLGVLILSLITAYIPLRFGERHLEKIEI